MEELLRDLVAHNIQNRTVALIENGTWAATSGRLMRQLLDECKNMTFLGETVQPEVVSEGDRAMPSCRPWPILSPPRCPKPAARRSPTRPRPSKQQPTGSSPTACLS